MHILWFLYCKTSYLEMTLCVCVCIYVRGVASPPPPFLNRQGCVLYGPEDCCELQPFRKHSLLSGLCDLLHEECKWYVKFCLCIVPSGKYPDK